jgi:hypothetical protein
LRPSLDTDNRQCDAQPDGRQPFHDDLLRAWFTLKECRSALLVHFHHQTVFYPQRFPCLRIQNNVAGIRMCWSPNCRSEPARDDGESAGIDVECTRLIASKLAPTAFGAGLNN